jgi:hypothetical protein
MTKLAHQNMFMRKLELRVWVDIPQGRLARRAIGTTGSPSANLMKPLLNFIIPMPFVIPPSEETDMISVQLSGPTVMTMINFTVSREPGATH